MGGSAPRPSITIPAEPKAPEVYSPEEVDIAEQKRRAQISASKKSNASYLAGASSDSDITTLLRRSILGA